MKSQAKQRAERYAIGNRGPAEIILADIARYGGEGALPVLWARLVMAAERMAPATGRAA